MIVEYTAVAQWDCLVDEHPGEEDVESEFIAMSIIVGTPAAAAYDPGAVGLHRSKLQRQDQKFDI